MCTFWGLELDISLDYIKGLFWIIFYCILWNQVPRSRPPTMPCLTVGVNHFLLIFFSLSALTCKICYATTFQFCLHLYSNWILYRMVPFIISSPCFFHFSFSFSFFFFEPTLLTNFTESVEIHNDNISRARLKNSKKFEMRTSKRRIFF